uniref:Zinc finger, CCHC-type n=1 Tax=Tanacetum cinerariifolium TaxID=118510 RepID=A0A699HGC6_TANCI|nr:zinc finger, CCHC-type [Tanacetum cinerariifolium]
MIGILTTMVTSIPIHYILYGKKTFLMTYSTNSRLIGLNSRYTHLSPGPTHQNIRAATKPRDKLAAVRIFQDAHRQNTSATRVRKELPSASTNHSRKSTLREGAARKDQSSLETRGRVCLHTQTTQGVGHTTIAAETPKAVTRVLVQGKQSLLLKNVITKEHPHERWNRYQEVKIVQEDTESQNSSGRSRALRTICPNHGYVKKQTLSLPGSVTLILQKPECLVTSRHTTEQEAGQKQNFKKGGFRNQLRSKRKHDMFTLLAKMPKEILALDKEKFKPPPPMTTPVEKKNASKFCEFHGEVGHTVDECMHLKRQIEEMLKAEKLSHLIKELTQNNRKDQTKAAKKGKTLRKDKPLTILMVQPWQRISKQRITQTFSLESVISFPPLEEEDGTEGPMIIKAETRGHFVHRISSMVPTATPLVGFSGEIISPLGQLSLLVKIGNEEHSISTWMNFMVHDYSARMHNGLRTRSIAARNRSSHRRKDSDKRKRGQAPERNKAVYKAVEKLVDADFKDLNIEEADVIMGIRIKHESNMIAISQSHYIDKVLKKFNYFDCTLVCTRLDTSEKLMPNNGQDVSQLEYYRVIGSLIYAVTCTKPDITFAVGKLSSCWLFLLCGGAIYWASKKQFCITGSTMKTKFVALAAAGKEAKWLRNLIFEIPLWSKPIAPISIIYDSASTLAKAYSQLYNGNSRHLGFRHSIIRELIMNEMVSIEFVRS